MTVKARCSTRHEKMNVTNMTKKTFCTHAHKKAVPSSRHHITMADSAKTIYPQQTLVGFSKMILITHNAA